MTIRNERTVCAYGVSFWAEAQSICYLSSCLLKELPIPIQGESRARRTQRDGEEGGALDQKSCMPRGRRGLMQATFQVAIIRAEF